MPKKILIDVVCQFLFETDAAICITDEDPAKKIWLPKSQIEFEIDNRNLVTITLPEWLATEKGLI